jgi:hypothetical protein
MPIASYFSLQWYGPECNAVVMGGLGDMTGSFEVTASGSAALSGSAVALTTGIGIGEPRPVSIAGLGATTSGQIVHARGAVNILVNDLTQDDVTGAVLEAFVEDDLTLKQALRLLLAQAAGNATGLDGGAMTFKSLDGTKTRVGGTVVAGSRTVTTRDAT